jgi:ATP-binding cassette, subfamily B, bacterial
MIRLRGLVRVMFGHGFTAAPGWMWATLVLAVANGVTAAVFPYGFKVFTDAFVADDPQRLTAGAVVTAGLIAANWLAGFFQANVGFGLHDRTDLFVQARTGELVNGVAGIEHFERPEYLRELDLIEQNRGLLSGAPRESLMALMIVVRSVGMVVLLVTVHPVLAVLPLFALAPALAESWSVRIRQRAEEHVAERKRLEDHLFSLASTAGPAKEVRIYGLADELAQRHHRAGEDVSRATIRAATVGSLLATAGWIVFVAGFVAAIGLVVLRATRGDATAGEVVMVVVTAQLIRQVLGLVAVTAGQLLTTGKTALRFLWLEDFAQVRTRHRDTRPAPPMIREGIAFEDVTFRYPGTDSDVLSDVDLFVPAGTIVAVVGENGAGKTTIMKLLAQMYEPTHGTIRVDGIDLGSIDHASWRSTVSATLQDFVPFEFVASETVGVGDLARIDHEPSIRDALERASAGDVISTLGDGLATQLGRSFVGGRDLSGGQWQKLALGRGMMRDAPLLLILDEPTASLDATTEHELFERYADAARRTRSGNGGITILVSHRFSTVRVADVIIVLDGGGVIETGSHAELMANNGLYAELFTLQARAYR